MSRTVRHLRSGMLRLLLGVVFSASFVQETSAGDKAWKAVSGDWFTDANWNPAGVPAATDNVTIHSGTVTLNADATVADFTLSGGTLTGTGTLTVNGSLTWTAGTMSGAGATTAMSGMSLGGSIKTLDTRTLNLGGGTASMDAQSSRVTMINGAVFHNQATFEVSNDGGQSNGQGFFTGGGATSSFLNQGTFHKTNVGNSGTTEFTGVAFLNTGSVEVQAGTLRLAGGSNGTSTGSYTADANATLSFNGGTHNLGPTAAVGGAGTVLFDSGTVNLSADAQHSYNVTGATTVSGGTANFTGSVTSVGLLSISTGTASFSTGSEIVVPGLTLSGGILSGPDTVTVNGPMTWSGGTIERGGTGPNAVVNATNGLSVGGSIKTLDTRTLNLSGGTASMDGQSSRVTMINGAVFHNQATFEASNDGGQSNSQGFFTGGGATSSFVNQGTFRKTNVGSSGTTEFTGVAFLNTGSVEVQAGTLRLAGGSNGTSTGSYTADANATLSFNGGTHNLGPTAAVSGAGTALFDSGTANLSADAQHSYNVSGATAVSGGTANFTGRVTSVGLLSISTGTASFSTGVEIVVPTLTLTGGTLSGSDTVTVTGLLTWSTGTIQRGGTGLNAVVNAMSGMSLGGSLKTLDARTLNLSGGTASMNAQSSRITMINGAVFHNQATFEASNDGGSSNSQGFFGGGGAASSFVNDGTFRKTDVGNSGTTELNTVGFTNTGTVEIDAGSVRGSGGYTQTAGTTRLNGGSLALQGKTLNIQGGTLAGRGTVTGDVTVSNGAHVSPGLSRTCQHPTRCCGKKSRSESKDGAATLLAHRA